MPSHAGLVTERKVLRVNVSQAAKAAVEGASTAYDMTQEGVASRLYQWFGEQTKTVQRAVLGLGDAEAFDRVRRELKPYLGIDGEADADAESLPSFGVATPPEIPTSKPTGKGSK